MINRAEIARTAIFCGGFFSVFSAALLCVLCVNPKSFNSGLGRLPVNPEHGQDDPRHGALPQDSLEVAAPQWVAAKPHDRVRVYRLFRIHARPASKYKFSRIVECYAYVITGRFVVERVSDVCAERGGGRLIRARSN
jgi:hypothetical protein